MDESEVLKFEQQVRPMRLSEAIRLGARLRPQLTSGLWQENGMSCAIGAAYEADTGIFSEDLILPASWMVLHRPAFCEYENKYGISIMKDNDKKKIPREAIADRLEAIGF